MSIHKNKIKLTAPTQYKTRPKNHSTALHLR